MKSRLHSRGAVARKRRASVFLASILMIMFASFIVTGWLAYITESHRQANRDRARVHAFMAAESGVEMVIDWFNHSGYMGEAGTYPGIVPEVYSDSEFATYGGNPAAPDFQDYTYSLFEPYVLSVHKEGKFDNANPPNWSETIQRDELNRPVRIVTTWLTPNDISKIPTCELMPKPQGGQTGPWLEMKKDGKTLAMLNRIVLINPADFAAFGEPAPANSKLIICKVIAEATAPELDGATVRVETLLRENPLFSISSPGAIITGMSANYNGQYNVNWGELWAKQNIPLPSNFTNKVTKPSADPWFRMRTSQYLRDSGLNEYANGHDAADGFTPYKIEDKNDINYYTPFQYVASNDVKLRQYRNLMQQQDLVLPRYDYDLVKDFFITMDLPYYYTDTDGGVIGIENGQWVKKEFSAWFDSDPADADYWDDNQQLVFIDSVPVNNKGEIKRDAKGMPLITNTHYPRRYGSAGAVIPSIQESGQGLHTRGAFFINANIQFQGSGSVPSSRDITKNGQPWVTKPDKTAVNNVNVSHNGLLYSWAELHNSANRNVFGSVFAEQGFAAGGGPDVYYNYRMKDGSWLNIANSVVVRVGWGVRTKSIPEIN